MELFSIGRKIFYQGHEINEKTLKTASLQNGFISRWDMCFRMQIPSFSVEVWKRKLHLARSRWGFRKRRLKKNRRLPALIWIGKLRDRPPYHLSGGEKRKVSLACILSLNPEVLILDEPLAGLDEKHRICWWIFCRVFIKQENVDYDYT